MDLSKDVVLKENYSFFVADGAGQITGGEHGLYNRDTRFLNRYCWRFGEAFETLLLHTPRPDRLRAHYARIEGPSQTVGIQRHLDFGARGFDDRLRVENTSPEPVEVALTLELGADFVDMFEARGWHRVARAPVALEPDGAAFRLRYRAEDGLETSVRLAPSQPPTAQEATGLRFVLPLQPGEVKVLTLEVTLHNPLAVDAPGISYESWRAGFDVPALSDGHGEVLARAIDDLRALLLFTEHGLYPAAGIPWYVAAFGRDALLSAYMLLPHHPEVAEGTLRFLAAYQGRTHDPVTAEAPGKILHEVRYGELSRTGKVPFRRYYGTVDATPLFVVLLHELYRVTGDLALVRELKPNWEAALAWMLEDGDPDGDGFLEFVGAPMGQGLSVQTWKDSHDSMSHADGYLASGAIAGSEVQGYAYDAFEAAATFYDALGEAGGDRWRARASELKERFHEAFWVEELQTYAMALDGDKCPLRVHNSNAGQLLWTGIVPEAVAPRLVATLFSETNWTGWGFRTLGRGEKRYNPVSYHNGSVWPHDTALVAGGLARYGFAAEAARVREALFDLAHSQADRRLPELIAGYEREDAPPVPYPVACRPQAWDAAALLYLLRL
ncbi:glycogen debranching N-terminal domain-containing protein [Truepera radiovictrix]|uniref:Amylo-alpha-16-glucosidase n=1 Tax=Truepera radiovictrix (strain DSM 17093 / CIP 108686 / LMG 22925 / RQ-24) TaxID=649638 RepID=D7CVR3_TRURR|nr:glycogen debranching N-terminal domain-containing protein [Truepera radiovictrix]ADI15974.1 Amylo-alpha-16-glucosidase [Truepera radiovictrix DSM 17093]WMT58400.1 glycogen debranching N-terminal domain-containing protein [Truepera radiovictrix]